MKLLTILTQLILALPLLAIVVNNLIPRETMRHSTIGMSVGVATAQLLASLAGFALLAASGEGSFRFSLAWDLGKGLGYFRVDLVTLFLLSCVGLVTLASTMTAFTSIDDHRLVHLHLQHIANALAAPGHGQGFGVICAPMLLSP